MRLREFFQHDAVELGLRANTKDEILKELIALLRIDEQSQDILFKMLKRRENLGTTGIGRGTAIPHCRSLVIDRLRCAYGRKSGGVDFAAVDNKPVFHFFLIVAPPLEISYLPVLGKIAQFARNPGTIDQLNDVQTPEEFLALLDAPPPG
jgi:mannitol/fructose-specific phosphotransferase system IIA component (Ntr-type)